MRLFRYSDFLNEIKSTFHYKAPTNTNKKNADRLKYRILGSEVLNSENNEEATYRLRQLLQFLGDTLLLDYLNLGEVPKLYLINLGNIYLQEGDEKKLAYIKSGKTLDKNLQVEGNCYLITTDSISAITAKLLPANKNPEWYIDNVIGSLEKQEDESSISLISLARTRGAQYSYLIPSQPNITIDMNMSRVEYLNWLEEFKQNAIIEVGKVKPAEDTRTVQEIEAEKASSIFYYEFKKDLPIIYWAFNKYYVMADLELDTKGNIKFEEIEDPVKGKGIKVGVILKTGPSQLIGKPTFAKFFVNDMFVVWRDSSSEKAYLGKIDSIGTEKRRNTKFVNVKKQGSKEVNINMLLNNNF